MELKKYFHEKILIKVISTLIGMVLVAIFIALITDEINVISTYAFLYGLFSALTSIITSNVKTLKRQRYKINKEWIFISVLNITGVFLAIMAFYTVSTFYRLLAIVLLLIVIGASYSLYRFSYIQKLAKDMRFKQEMLHFSWGHWGYMLDKGAKNEDVADLIVNAQSTADRSLNSSTWGARFSQQTLGQVIDGKDPAASDDVVISDEIKANLKQQALHIVAQYEKKNLKKE